MNETYSNITIITFINKNPTTMALNKFTSIVTPYDIIAEHTSNFCWSIFFQSIPPDIYINS